jgi:hypothetical protein
MSTLVVVSKAVLDLEGLENICAECASEERPSAAVLLYCLLLVIHADTVFCLLLLFCTSRCGTCWTSGANKAGSLPLWPS